jgi:NAD(P)-dependent dehydrogenase (short-subunit alcohol dehydrogenase family)
MRLPPVQPKHVVVTGCSSGIGAATAALLRDRGWRVVATARKPEDLETLRLSGYATVRLDLADEASVQSAAAEATDLLDGVPGALVNNAGYGQAGAVEDLTRVAMRDQFEVNVLGMQQFTNLFIPPFRQAGCGRIVNVSSVLGRVSLPFNGIYSASKFAMEALSDALRVELRDAGIGVCLVEPGPVATAFRANAVAKAEQNLAGLSHSPHYGLYQKEVARSAGDPQRVRRFTASPEAVARRILHALTAGRPNARYCVTPQAHLGAWMSRLAPDVLIDYLFSRSLRRKLERVGQGGTPDGP